MDSSLADLAERDDRLFARAQWMVRHALLARANALAIDRDDIFWLAARGGGGGDGDRSRLGASPRGGRARAAAARAALGYAGCRRRRESAEAEGQGRAAYEASASGASVTGRVVRFASLASAIAVGRGDIVVTRAVTPALAVLVAGCAAIVSETGGLLDHGAALARELGVPCVVGCHGAWSALRDGEIVRIDGDAGTVTPL